MNGADQFVAGFGDAATFGATTKIREAAYGDTATRNHEGGLFAAGGIAGDVTTGVVGGAALKGPQWAKRGYQLYDKANDRDEMLTISSQSHV